MSIGTKLAIERTIPHCTYTSGKEGLLAEMPGRLGDLRTLLVDIFNKILMCLRSLLVGGGPAPLREVKPVGVSEPRALEGVGLKGNRTQ
jgi:hypothetical protein